MSPLQVDPVALRLLAARCRDWSIDLSALSPPGEFGCFPAAAAAAAGVETGVRAVAGQLAARMRDTAALLEETARRFQDREDDSTHALAAPPKRP